MGNAANIDPEKKYVTIEGDRTREFKLGHKGYTFLAKKYGTVKKAFEQYQGDGTANGLEGMTFDRMEAIADFAYAGLMSDATKNKENLTREMVVDFLDVDFEGFFAQINGGITESLPEGNGAEADPTNAPT
jgi:hypothetical protein